MEHSNLKSTNEFIIVPHEILKSIELNQIEIINSLKQITDLIKGNSSNFTLESLDRIDEKKAIQILGKKATWFWQMRKAGLLNYSKVGSKVYYSIQDIKKLLDEGCVK
jgi:hypothetical protein